MILLLQKFALCAVSRRVWLGFLPLSLFSRSVTAEAKQQTVDKLQHSKIPGVRSVMTGTGYGKSQFPVLPSQVEKNLSIFIGTDSWLFFEILKLDKRLLVFTVKDWESKSAYKEAEEVAASLIFVNDAAERGAKLSYDFLQSFKKEENQQNILQVVYNCRNKLPK